MVTPWPDNWLVFALCRVGCGFSLCVCSWSGSLSVCKTLLDHDLLSHWPGDWGTLCLPYAELGVICQCVRHYQIMTYCHTDQVTDRHCVCPVQSWVWSVSVWDITRSWPVVTLTRWLTDVVFALCRAGRGLSVCERSCSGPQGVCTILESACVHTRISKQNSSLLLHPVTYFHLFWTDGPCWCVYMLLVS